MKKGLKYNFLAVIILLQITIFSLGLATDRKPITAEAIVEKTIALADKEETKEEVVVEQPKEIVTEQPKQVVKQETKKESPKKEAKQEVKQEVEQPKQEVKQETVEQPTEVAPPETIVEQPKMEVGSISISNSNFKKDLVKDDTSYFYLNHSLSGVYDQIGVPFIDFRNNFKGRKTIIYAHSSKTVNAPFNYLQNYHNNKSFYDQHKYIYVTYAGESYTYEIFSVYISVANSDTDAGLEYYRVMNYSNNLWGEKIQEYKANSEYETGVQVSSSDKILILQTCAMDPNYAGKHYRDNLLIMAKRI
jgi:SrtB family sortase